MLIRFTKKKGVILIDHFDRCAQIIHGQGDHRLVSGPPDLAFPPLDCPLVPTDALALSQRLACSQSSSRSSIPNTVRAAVFVLPNSIPFHSPLCALCLFWCSFTPWGLTEPENENISPTSNPVTPPLEAASSAFLGLSERQRGWISSGALLPVARCNVTSKRLEETPN